MRILAIQLARFGDIYQTWPALKALQRTKPGTEIHVLVRERFQEAIADLPGIQVHSLPTQGILTPIICGDGLSGEDQARETLEEFLQPLRDLRFDLVCNLSYSPFSSYLTDDLSEHGAEVHGYSRHRDGHFNIPDDASSYFYAQVGIGRANRYHLTDLFAATVGVDLQEQDFCSPIDPSLRSGVVVHLGTSEVEKTYPAELWIQVLKSLIYHRPRVPITLIGSRDERPLSEAVLRQIGPSMISNRVGQTTLTESFVLIANSKLLVGADSAPIHMASLTDTPTLNLSCAYVNFWETGPIASGSRILYAERISEISALEISAEVLSMLDGMPLQGPCIFRSQRSSPYQTYKLEFEDFAWCLTQALYTDASYPQAQSAVDLSSMQRLFELADLALVQLERWEDADKSRSIVGEILTQIDALLLEVIRLNPRVEPLVQWFETQRLRMGPMTPQATLAATQQIFSELKLVTSIYRQGEGDSLETSVRQALHLIDVCVPELREYKVSLIADNLHMLWAQIQDIASTSTKVAPANVLLDVGAALESRDYIYLADILQWTLRPSLLASVNEGETFTQDMIS